MLRRLIGDLEQRNWKSRRDGGASFFRQTRKTLILVEVRNEHRCLFSFRMRAIARQKNLWIIFVAEKIHSPFPQPLQEKNFRKNISVFAHELDTKTTAMLRQKGWRIARANGSIARKKESPAASTARCGRGRRSAASRASSRAAAARVSSTSTGNRTSIS